MELTQTTTISKGRLWTSWILSGIAILFLLFDITGHLFVPQPVVDSFKQIGVPLDLSVTIGVIELICLILYVIPSTSIFGAILITGYLGGAVAIKMRIGSPLFSDMLFPVYVAILVWSGIYLRDARLRELIPFRK